MSNGPFCSKEEMQKKGDEKCPAPNDTVAYSNQIVLEGQCTIPDTKPDKEKIFDIHHSIEIRKAQTINSTEVIDNREVRGKKVVVAGLFNLGIEYSAKTPDQRVHFFHCSFPFQGLILREVNGEERLLPRDFSLDDYLVHVCVEDLQIEQIDERTINRTVVLMIWLEPKQ
ncbi:SPOCS domain-containing protein [Halanaerobaculum tunisiense]